MISSEAVVDLSNPFPLLFQVPIYGRITNMVPFSLSPKSTSLVFFLTDRHQYGVLGYNHNAVLNGLSNINNHYIVTHASGTLTAASLWAQGGGGGGTHTATGNNHDTAAMAASAAGGWANDNTLAVLGQDAPAGPMVIIDPLCRCIVMHLHSGLLAVIPIHRNYNHHKNKKSQQYKSDADLTPPRKFSSPSSLSPSSCLGQLFHCRIEERLVLNMTFLQFPQFSSDNADDDILPHISILHQDARGVQHISTHVLHLQKRQLFFCQSSNAGSSNIEWLRKSAVDGGSSRIIPVPPLLRTTLPAAKAAAHANPSLSSTTTASTLLTPAWSGGIIVLGQRQFTYLSSTTTKIIPVPQALYLSCENLPDDNGMPRFLIGDEFGNLHMLTLLLANTSNSAPPTTNTAAPPSSHALVLGLHFETLGSCNLSRYLCYLGQGLVYVASHLGDSQLIQIHDEPIPVHEGVHPSTAAGRFASDLDDSALVDNTYIQVLEEYTSLGPILDFDLIPTVPTSTNAGVNTVDGMMMTMTTTANNNSGSNSNNQMQQQQQSQVVTCSGTSKMGSLRVIRNGIGMKEYASVEMPGISNMWSLRKTFSDISDTFLVQSFVGQTRVLGVTMNSSKGSDTGDETMMMAEQDEQQEEEQPFGSLEEVILPGLESNASTLYVGNLVEDRILQITDAEIRLIHSNGNILDTWSNGPITVAAANESGQIALAQRGGNVIYLTAREGRIRKVAESVMEREVSCLNLNPFLRSSSLLGNSMDVDEPSRWLAVGLWDDFTVRLLDLSSSSSSTLKQVQKIHLSSSQPEGGDDEEEDAEMDVRRNRNNMMARSLCLITLDFSSGNNQNNAARNNDNNATTSTSSVGGVDMLFVGLGDGTLISFVVMLDSDGQVSVRSKKAVCLGTQRIDLIPLNTRGGGSCVLATGDRPTVIYLAGGGGSSGGTQFNPKLCYSSVNLSASEEDDHSDDETHALGNRPPSHQNITVNVAAPFYSPLLFDASAGQGTSASSPPQHYSLCIADETSLRLGVIDDIQKLHVTTCRLGMAPRRIVHCGDGRLFAVGCMESGIQLFGAAEPANSMGNCIRFMDDTTFDDLKKIDLDPFEIILSMAYVSLRVPTTNDRVDSDGLASCKPFLVVGTGFGIADESEITRGRILLFSCEADDSATATSPGGGRTVRQVTEMSTNGGVFSICQFFDGTILCAINSKTMLCRLHDDAGLIKLEFVGVGHHGHIISMFVKSRAARQEVTDAKMMMAIRERQPGSIDGAKPSGLKMDKSNNSTRDSEEMLAIVGDLMRSVSLVQYFPEHQILDEIARDFNANWTTAVEMLTDDIYLAAEHWCNLYCLRRNKMATSEEVRGRLDIVGEYHLGEMCNKFMSGSLVMPISTSSGLGKQSAQAQQHGMKKAGGETTSNTRGARRPTVVTGSQTLFGTVDGSLGVILGLDGRTAAFFSTLERAMAKVIRPIGDLSHHLFRAYLGERRSHPAHGFVDGDLIESFLDLDRATMEIIVQEMNRDGGWEVDDANLTVKPGTSEENTAVVDSSLLTVDDVVARVEEISMLH